MSKVVLNYWPSVLLSLVLLAGIVACLERLDFLVVEEVRALISILFGFATSCLLLSFVWLIQRKPLHRTWPQRHLGGAEVPNMDPRARGSSSSSNGSSYQREPVIVSTISSGQLDVPPTYEDALVNSKPLFYGVHVRNQTSCTCYAAQQRIRENNQSMGWCQRGKPTILACEHCSKAGAFANDLTNHKYNHNDESCPPPNSSSLWASSNESRLEMGKFSFLLLDASQLPPPSSSPPKYQELHLDRANSPNEADKRNMDMA